MPRNSPGHGGMRGMDVVCHNSANGLRCSPSLSYNLRDSKGWKIRLETFFMYMVQDLSRSLEHKIIKIPNNHKINLHPT